MRRSWAAEYKADNANSEIATRSVVARDLVLLTPYALPILRSCVNEHAVIQAIYHTDRLRPALCVSRARVNRD
jgi:hypothetical protein